MRKLHVTLFVINLQAIFLAKFSGHVDTSPAPFHATCELHVVQFWVCVGCGSGVSCKSLLWWWAQFHPQYHQPLAGTLLPCFSSRACVVACLFCHTLGCCLEESTGGPNGRSLHLWKFRLTLALLSEVFWLPHRQYFCITTIFFYNTHLRLHDFVQYTFHIMYMHFIPIIFRFYASYFWKTDWGSQVTPLSMKRNFILRGLVAQAVRHSPPTAGSRVRVSLTPCGFRGGRNGVWVGFSRGFSRFLLPQISFHHFFTLISSI